MIFKLIAAALILLASQVSAKTEKEKADWLIEKRRIIDAAKAANDDNSVEKLGPIVRGLGQDDAKGELDPEEKEILKIAKETLLAIPNHVDYLVGKIEEMTNKDLAGDYSSGEMRYFYYEVLQQLQTPQSVAALGNLLFDENDPWKDKHWGDGGRPLPNAHLALLSLGQIGLNNPPTANPEPLYTRDLRTWQLWFEQVRAGTRTFSFKGDDRIYNLAGSVGEAPATPGPQLAPPSVSSLPAVEESHSHWPLLLALTLLLAVGGWFALRPKKTSP